MFLRVLREVLGACDRCMVVASSVNWTQLQEEVEKSDIPNELVEIVIQKEQLGTGHATEVAVNALKLDADDSVVVVNGDSPFLTAELVKSCSGGNAMLLAELDDPTGCGRTIVENDSCIKVIEERCCTDEERKIKLINCGVYGFRFGDLVSHIGKLTKDPHKEEWYLTTIYEPLTESGIKTKPVLIPDFDKKMFLNVNTQEELAKAELLMQEAESDHPESETESASST